MQIYQVGGAVRDELLEIEAKDRDWVVVGGTPEEMASLGYKAVGKDFPVFLHPDTREAFALARTERKVGPGYKGFTFNTSKDVTLKDDLQRRDITINAIAKDDKGNIIDPFGGEKDLKEKIIRHVSPAFTEDPLRVLRVARFAARFHFTVAEETLTLLEAISATNELEALAPERVWAETEKALQTEQPQRYFEVLRGCNALIKVFPEIDKLFGIPQPEKYHPEIDSGIHTIMVLEQATKLSTDPEVLFAALVHDLGKGTTPEGILPGHHGHEQRGVDLILRLCERLRIPNKYKELAIIVARHHLDCHRIADMKPATILDRLNAVDAFRRPDRFAQFLLACEADARGRRGLEQRHYPQAGLFMKFYEACLKIDAKSLDMETLNGRQIAEQIRTQRIDAIREMKQTVQFND